jgi:hypothetical protein
MDLKRKLQRLLPQPSDAPTIQTHRVPSLDHILHGQEVSTPFGACYMMEKSLPLTALHGHWPLREVLDADYGSLRAFRCGLEPRLDLKEALFLDTETTGLAGGDRHLRLFGRTRLFYGHPFCGQAAANAGL